MPIIEMIPREYWLQLHRELSPLVPELLAEERAAREERDRQRAERLDALHRRYDEAVRCKRRQSRKGAPITDKRRAQLRAAAQRYRDRKQQEPK